MSLGDVVNQLLDKHSLADTSTSEETDLATTSVGSQKVDDLDTGLKNFGGGRLLDESRGIGVNGELLVSLDGTTLINGLANDVHDTAKGALADGDHDGGTGVDDLLTTDETLGTIHGNGTAGVLTKVGSNFEDETTTVEVDDLERIENRGEVFAVELNIDDGTDDSLNSASHALGFGRIGAGC